MQTTTTQAPWFEEWFDSSYYHTLYQHRDETEAAAFIDRLLLKLCPAPHAAMLDLGCGSGRHSIRLAQKGHEVTGYDLSFNSIAKAKAFTAGNLRFEQKDMREDLGFEAYDYLFSFFTSFGYFTEDDNGLVASNMATALKPGGMLTLDYLNAHAALVNLVRFDYIQRAGIRFYIRRWSDEMFLYKRISIEDPLLDQRYCFTEKVRMYQLADFKTMFEERGLRLTSVHGNYNLEPFRCQESKRLILLFEKE